ncbi:MAG: hypothetical protein HGA45_33045, partial [Chloroflexales bacterium]|nr:hypothetical protein [Chloroflexales bacterium]
MNRERLLIIYALAVGAAGWIWLLATPSTSPPPIALILVGTLALAI